MKSDQTRLTHPERISSYFKQQLPTLTIVTISGLLYNVGMVLGPLYEGYMAQCLYEIISGTATYESMVKLAITYIIVILFIQGMRYIKRFYVRRFANNINRSIKHILYNSLAHKSKAELANESAGSLMTKAISDVDACTEGMRKFTTEVFDTGVVMIAYLSLLFHYDWRLALISGLFPPIAYFLAERLKKPVTRSAATYKQATAQLNDVTLDNVNNLSTYRLFGQADYLGQRYQKQLTSYEHKAVKAGIWETAMPPVYLIISLAGIIPIIWFGARNVLHLGWALWDIAAFSTFLSCFTKLATKASKAAKLFNAVQKAQVSWKRIKPLMVVPVIDTKLESLPIDQIQAQKVSFNYPDGPIIIHDFNLTAQSGTVVGVTGPVACGKSTLGRVFLNEYPYQGSLTINGIEVNTLTNPQLSQYLSYQGHDCELLNDTIAANIQLGEDFDVTPYLQAVCLNEEVDAMEQGSETIIGPSGSRLSGGQQARLALARILAHPKPLLILDDPFAAVDRQTEIIIWNNLQPFIQDKVVILISHRLYLFPTFTQVVWIQKGLPVVTTHEKLLKTNEAYARLYDMQVQGGDHQ